MDRALTETATLWDPIRRAYPWVWNAAAILANPEHAAVEVVRAAFLRVRRSIGLVKRHCGTLEPALTHFLKVTRSYSAGLFHCYADLCIPRTNNDLEQCFGQHRYHERRATGRKRGTPSTVLHGSARLLTGVASRRGCFTARDLVPRDLAHWQKFRQAIRQRFAMRAQGLRFRRDPATYLTQLEERYLKSALPV